MKTTHKIAFGEGARPRGSRKIDLCVTSPPYPMVSMWDDFFSAQDPEVGKALSDGDGMKAFARMHRELGSVWDTVSASLAEGGTCCVNIGDATRTLNGRFRVYPNHAEVIRDMEARGFKELPEIIWRKTSNKPNKFMGSGMLPPGAYVTQEHEYILIFRKGLNGKRATEQRGKSAYFWEERNNWFSDVWEGLKGERQKMEGGGRQRSASFPFELPYRLISMFSVRGDLVCDPFLGTGTTALAAMATARDSVSAEIDPRMEPTVRARLLQAVESSNSFNRDRLRKHISFASSRAGMNYRNENYGFNVMTRQERMLELPKLESVTERKRGTFEVEYADEPLSLED